MSAGTQNTSDEQPVVGEPASHPHQAVVVGEPPEDVAPVLGEPAFANGLQDQQLILPPSSEETSANGGQSSPYVPVHEEELATVEPSSSDAGVPPSAASVEETPDVQHAPPTDDAIGEAGTHQQEATATESFNQPDPHGDEVTRASDDPVVRSADPGTPIYSSVHSTEEQPAADIPEAVEVTHTVDSPPEASFPRSDVSTENSSVAPGEDLATAPGEILERDTHFTDGAPSSTPEASLKGLDDCNEEASLSSAAPGDKSMENTTSTQTDCGDVPLEVGKADNEYVQAAEAEQGSQGGALAQESNVKEANLEDKNTGCSVVEHPLAPELDGAVKTGGSLQGNDSETISREGEHALSREAPPSEASILESSTPEKVMLNDSHNAPIVNELPGTYKLPDEAPLMDQGTRGITAEEYTVDQPLDREASFTMTSNGDNSHQYGEDGELEREQDLPKDDDDDASEAAAKPSPRSKLPLIFTGLAIAAVGVAVASISRPH